MNRKYTEKQANFIRENVKGTGAKKLTEMFNDYFKSNIKITSIRAFMKNNKLNNGIDGRFQNGRIPSNKGTGTCPEGCKGTLFKKGAIPLNHRLVGSERVTVEGYTEIKIAEPNKWRLKQQITWEKHNGNVPKGYVVIFGDGNKCNLDIDNLILVSRPQLFTLNMNNLIQNDVDLTRTGVIIADLYLKISKIKNKK